MEITVIDDMHPEDLAMLQALYSRSPASVKSHLEKVKRVGSGQFMGQYYVGYNHKSIGDCGNTTIFIEGVSMLAAKAIQNNPLYSGQEASTRYMDMSRQPIKDPTGKGGFIQEAWMEFYTSNMDKVTEHLVNTLPRGNEPEETFRKAAAKRAFDVMRGFLPAGCSTNVSWTTNLRQAQDHLDNLRHHPMREVREIAVSIIEKLGSHYPNSFKQKQYPQTELYLALTNGDTLWDPMPTEVTLDMSTSISVPDSFFADCPAFAERPEHCRLPHRFDDLGQVRYEFLLDFGSFRDIQRHRNGVCNMPMLSTMFGFESWYLNQLPEDVADDARQLISRQIEAIRDLPGSRADKQAYVAMGFRVPCDMTRGLPGTLYLIELRSGKATHPTLRKVAHWMANELLLSYPSLKMHVDFDPSWSAVRANQDIIEKRD